MREDRALKRFGCDLQCPGCSRWMHAENCGKCFRVTEWHWHYRCDCGADSHWLVGVAPAPLFDQDRGADALAKAA